jgi:phospholipase/carboxylesterase
MRVVRRIRVPSPGRWWAGLTTFLVAAAGCRASLSGDSAGQGPAWGGLEVREVGGSPAGASATVVVLLHGWGAPGDDLVPLARELARPDLRFVVPAAPLPHAYGGRAWWHLDLERRQRATAEGRTDQIAAEVPEGLSAARAKVQGLLREVRSRYRPRTLVLAGFSQGGMLALDVALAANPPVDRVAVLSGTLIAEKLWSAQMSRDPKLPVFLTHGRQDPILPFATSERLKALLERHGFPVTWVPFDGGHGIPPAVLDGLRAFLTPT